MSDEDLPGSNGGGSEVGANKRGSRYSSLSPA